MPRQARIDAPGALHHIIIRYKSILCEEDRYLKQRGFCRKDAERGQ